MDRNQLLAELRGHGNHLVVTRSESPADLARGLGLLLLAMEEVLTLSRSGRGRPGERATPTAADGAGVAMPEPARAAKRASSSNNRAPAAASKSRMEAPVLVPEITRHAKRLAASVPARTDTKLALSRKWRGLP